MAETGLWCSPIDTLGYQAASKPTKLLGKKPIPQRSEVVSYWYPLFEKELKVKLF